MSLAPRQVGSSRRTKVRKELLDQLVLLKGKYEPRERIRAVDRFIDETGEARTSKYLREYLDAYKTIADNKARFSGQTVLFEVVVSALALLLVYWGWLNADALGTLGLATTEGGVGLAFVQVTKTVYDEVSVLRTQRYNNNVFHKLMVVRITNLDFFDDEKKNVEFGLIAKALNDWCNQLVPEGYGGNCIPVE